VAPFTGVGEKDNAARRANHRGFCPRDAGQAGFRIKSLRAEEKLFHDQAFEIAFGECADGALPSAN